MTMKKNKRLHRASRTRGRIRVRGIPRLCVNRTPRHIYAQVTTSDGVRTLASACTVGKEMAAVRGSLKKLELAEKVGELVAQRAVAEGITEVAFDRSGYKYHGRVKALAEAARKSGLKF